MAVYPSIGKTGRFGGCTVSFKDSDFMAGISQFMGRCNADNSRAHDGNFHFVFLFTCRYRCYLFFHSFSAFFRSPARQFVKLGEAAVPGSAEVRMLYSTGFGGDYHSK